MFKAQRKWNNCKKFLLLNTVFEVQTKNREVLNAMYGKILGIF